ncbi:MAG: helix-turn-helix domain-containing protein [Planctomycetes bacterium]|nr:helix-turn-helix domain-containing protein [Planctomycetota bacterium]
MPQLMTVRQMAEFLQVSTDKVYEMTQRGEIPAIKIGQQWRFNRDDIEKWLKSCSRGQASVKSRGK